MKQGRVLRRAIPALVACMASGYAAASGFQLWEQNASGIGNAYAGSAAVAENASTVFFNPAGMTQLEGKNVSAGVTAIKTSYQFHNGASNTGVLTGEKNGGATGYVPNGYFSMAATKDLYFGLGISAPFGLKTDYGGPWQGAAQSISFEIKTLNVNPAVAYRVNDTVSLGFGLDWQKFSGKYVRVYSGATVNTADVRSTMDVSDDKWGWNAGVLVNLSPATKVGISYRSAIKHTATGTAAATSVSPGGAAVVAGLIVPALGAATNNVKADIKLPDTWIFSATQKLNDQWDMLGDLSLTKWSTIPKLDIIYTSGLKTGQIGQTLNSDFRDTWRAALGGTYKYSDATKLKFGIAYDQGAAKGPATRMVSLPDNNRWWLSFGVQWLPSKQSAVDVGVTRVFMKDPSINNDQTADNRGLVNGTYSNSGLVLGAQYSMSF